MWTKMFWMQTLERSAKTFAQALGGFFAANAAFDSITFDVFWAVVLVPTGLSVLTSVTSLPIGEANAPSLVPVPDTAKNTPPPAPLDLTVKSDSVSVVTDKINVTQEPLSEPTFDADLPDPDEFDPDLFDLPDDDDKVD